jgi:hypothetical protein
MQSNGGIMQKSIAKTAVLGSKTSFNYNKLQAVACIASSAAVSIGFIYYAIRSFF